MHINIAVSRALLNKVASMKTQSLGNEVLYHMYPTHSVRLATQAKYSIDKREL